MARKATGTEVEWIGGVATTRVRVGGKRSTFKLPACKSDADAEVRRKQLVELGARMVASNVDRLLAVAALRRVARAPAGDTLEDACDTVAELIGGWRPDPDDSECPTLGEVLERWAAGELHRKHPKHVKARKNCKPAVAGLRKYARALWSTRVDAVTLDACDEVANSLGHLRQGSQRQVLAPLKRILDYCVKPLKLIKQSPLPAKWLPGAGKTRSLQWLYPSEDAQLMACTAVPLWFRILCGYLVREGGREGEPIATTIDRFDFEAGRNTCSLPSGMIKTSNAKFWQLNAGTARALQAWFALRGARSTDLAFVNGDGERINADYVSLPAMLRAACKLAGITRPELYANTDDSRHLCVHDLRRSFVTVSLALDRSERWISARTGHLSSTELHGYEKQAASFAELHVGDWLPLDEAIPELRAVNKNLTFAQSETAAKLAQTSAEVARVSIDLPLAAGIAKPAQLHEFRDSIVELGALPQAPETAQLLENAPASGQTFPDISGLEGHSAAVRFAALEAELQAIRMLVERQPAALVAAVERVLGRTQSESAPRQ